MIGSFFFFISGHHKELVASLLAAWVCYLCKYIVALTVNWDTIKQLEDVNRGWGQSWKQDSADQIGELRHLYLRHVDDDPYILLDAKHLNSSH